MQDTMVVGVVEWPLENKENYGAGEKERGEKCIKIGIKRRILFGRVNFRWRMNLKSGVNIIEMHNIYTPGL